MCQISPGHVSMLTAFGLLCLAGGALSLFAGRTYYYGRLIERNNEPFIFWSTTTGLLALGSMCLYGLAVCQRG